MWMMNVNATNDAEELSMCYIQLINCSIAANFGSFIHVNVTFAFIFGFIKLIIYILDDLLDERWYSDEENVMSWELEADVSDAEDLKLNDRPMEELGIIGNDANFTLDGVTSKRNADDIDIIIEVDI